MKEPLDSVQDVVRYIGPKKPAMPLQASKMFKHSDILKQAIGIYVNRAKDQDFDFLFNVLDKPEIREYNVSNISFWDETGMMPARKSAVRYMPLINMKPAGPDTVYTGITKA